MRANWIAFRFATLIVGGVVLIALTFMRYSFAMFAWIAFAPFLLVLYERGTLTRHAMVVVALMVAFLIAVSKMATSEIPWAPPVPLFALPLALSYFAAIAMAAMVHRWRGSVWAAYTFASMTTTLSWVQYSFTPGSSWGALAHTQLGNLPLVQVAALTGVGGITFLVALGSALTAAVWKSGARVVRWHLLAFVLLLAAAHLYGQLRLSRPATGTIVRVAGVVSPVTHREFRTAYANVDTLRQFDDELFARTSRAADLGAKVLVWNEMATVVSIATEGMLAARGSTLARDRGVMLVMAYGVVVSMNPFRDINKYRIYLPDGALADEYVKRHPVPGDPDEVGTRHARVVVYDGVRYSGGICYDYGFPAIARDNAADGAEVALVPSSDWRGIDPEHGEMAMMNAVAVGLPMVRPVRAATSIATDQFGRTLAGMRADGSTDGVMVAAVPAKRIPTVYSRTGELVPLLAFAFCVAVALARFRRQRSEGKTLSPPSPPAPPTV